MDGLRALACLSVFGVHWQQTTDVRGNIGPLDIERLLLNGNTGVAVFMLLSGFLLSVPLFAKSVGQRLANPLPRYWRNRASRILPAYWLCLGLLVLASAHFRSPSQILDVVLHATFLHNLFPETTYSISPPFWAIAVFVRFYVLFYLVIILLRRFGTLSDRAILITFSVIAVVCQSIAIGLYYVSADIARNLPDGWAGAGATCLEHSLVIHMPIFWLGIIAAWVHRRLPGRGNVFADVFVIISAVIGLAILGTALDDRFQIGGTRYNFPLIPLLLAGVVLAVPRGRIVSGLLESPPVRRLGIVSYGFYLFHLPAMGATAKLASAIGIAWQSFPILFGIATATATFAGCFLLFEFVERPIQARMRSQANRSADAPSESTSKSSAAVR